MKAWWCVVLVLALTCAVISAWAQDEDPAAILNESIALAEAGDLEGALERFEIALEGFRQAGDRDNEALTLVWMGFVNYNLSRYEVALEAYEAALHIRHELGQQAAEGTVLNNIGAVYYKQGQYTLALDYYQQALDIRRDLGDRVGEAQTLSNMGLVYAGQGQYALALDNFIQALDLRRAEGDREGEGVTLNNIGRVYESQGQYAQALDYYQQALEIVREVGSRAWEGGALNNIGLVYKLQGQYAEALDYYQQALAIAREVGERATEGTILHNIGSVYHTQGRYTEALDYFAQALDIRREVGDLDGEGDTLHSMGNAYAKANPGRESTLALALEYYNRALNLRREIGDREGERFTLPGIGVLYEDYGQYEQAVEYYAKGVDLIEAVHADIRLESGQAAFAAENIWPYDRLVALLARSDAEQAFIYAERGRARTFLYQLANAQLAFGVGASAELLDAWQTTRDQLAALRAKRVALYNQVPAPRESIRELDHLIADLEGELSRLEDQIALQNPALGQFTRVDVPDLARIQAALPADTALLSYYVAEEDVFGFVLTPDNLVVVTLPPSPDALRETVGRFRADVSQIVPLVTLHEWLIAPLKGSFDTSRLLVAPHDVLNYVPFAALVDEAGAYLGESFTVGYTPSATVYAVLVQVGIETGMSETALVLGNPASQLPGLPGAEAEAEAVAALLDADLYLGAEATEGRLRAEIGEAGVVHIAAHGAFDKANPLSSFLALAPDEAHDGNLEVREVYALPLQDTHPLVVLSACQTAVGELTEGDEFQGLTRAFLLNGARAVVASLWAVEDEATSVLMTAFYENRAAGMGDAEALAAAQKIVREDAAHPEWRSPYYWAAFVLVGLGYQ